jgi:hypothetical protein
MLTSKKIHKTVKTKFKKNEDEQVKKQKQKNKDKNVFRLIRQERDEYVV